LYSGEVNPMSLYKIILNTLSTMLSNLPGEDAHKIMSPPHRLKLKEYQSPDKKPKLSSVLILLCITESDILIPLIRRNIYEGPHSGQISFPGGKVEESDTDSIHTAIRETEEELGISSGVEVIGTLTPLYIPISNYLVTPVLAVHKDIPAFIPDPAEVDEIHLVNLKNLADPLAIGNETFSSSMGKNFDAPCFIIGNLIIWGATAMIISELLHVFLTADTVIGYIHKSSANES